MKLLSLTCNHCGAPLDVPPSARFVTCGYCHARLKVEKSGNAWHTEVLEQVAQDARRIAEDVDHIRRQNELERLDREWLIERERYYTTDNNGVARVPSVAGSLFGAAFGAIVGVGWSVLAASAGAPALFAAVGLLIALVAVVAGIIGATKASDYAEAKRRYEDRRRALLHDAQPPSPTPR